MTLKFTKSIRLIIGISVTIAATTILVLLSWFSYTRLLKSGIANEPNMPSSFFDFVLKLLLSTLLPTILLSSLTVISFILCVREIKKIESPGRTVRSTLTVILCFLTLFLSYVVGYTGDMPNFYRADKSWIFLAVVNLFIWAATLLIKFKQGHNARPLNDSDK